MVLRSRSARMQHMYQQSAWEVRNYTPLNIYKCCYEAGARACTTVFSNQHKINVQKHRPKYGPTVPQSHAEHMHAAQLSAISNGNATEKHNSKYNKILIWSWSARMHNNYQQTVHWKCNMKQHKPKYSPEWWTTAVLCMQAVHGPVWNCAISDLAFHFYICFDLRMSWSKQFVLHVQKPDQSNYVFLLSGMLSTAGNFQHGGSSASNAGSYVVWMCVLCWLCWCQYIFATSYDFCVRWNDPSLVAPFV